MIDSKLHDVGFGFYFKGGSAHIIIAGNRVYRTDTMGLMVGFDTGECTAVHQVLIPSLLWIHRV